MSKPVILCVDDERLVLDSVKMQLKSAFGDAYLYEVAEDAKEQATLLCSLHKPWSEEKFGLAQL